MIVDVPENLRAPSGVRYPAHQTGPAFEVWLSDWFIQNKPAIKRRWLPICFTEFYLKHGFVPHVAIQRVLDSLDPDEKYATYVQNDDGVLETVPGNVLIFASGGIGDVAVPLLCDPHPVREMKRDVLASFAGMLTGHNDRTGVRSAMATALLGKDGFVIRESCGDVEGFRSLMQRSTYALCPRGYGKTSFRIVEAMQLGAIPVVIYDQRWLPYEDRLNWNEFAVLCHVSQLPDLPDMLARISPAGIEHKRETARQLREAYFTYTGCAKQILRMVNQ